MSQGVAPTVHLDDGRRLIYQKYSLGRRRVMYPHNNTSIEGISKL